MIRLLAAFAVLFIGAAACVSLLPSPAKLAQPPSAVAAQLRNEADPVLPPSSVRVVYPGPGTDVSQVRNISISEPAPVAAAAPAAVASAAVYPQAPGLTTADAAVTPPNQAAQAGGPGLNLNTASVEALNQIPGAGRIGRTIASHRPYHSVEDLLRKRVVKKSVYDRIKDQLAAE